MNDPFSCDACSLKKGITLWKDGTITNHSLVHALSHEFSSFHLDDPYWNQTCDYGYECIASASNSSDFGCCVACERGKYCMAESISYGNFLESNVCPDGYTCSESGAVECSAGSLCYQNNTLDCAEAVERNVWRELLMGMYCPAGSSELVMCPRGSVCETTVQAATCPAGFYCMGKSMEVWLKSPCPEGSTKLCRSVYGLIPVVLAAALIFGTLWAFCLLEKRRKEKTNVYRKKNDFAPLTAFLESLEKRICLPFGKKLSQNRPLPRSSLKPLTAQSFAVLDADGKGYLTYEEVRDATALTPKGYERFQYLMRIRGISSIQKIDEEMFDKHAFFALYAASKIEPTEEDVSDLFSKLDENGNGAIDSDELYDSELNFILDNGEVNDMIKEFCHRRGGVSDLRESFRISKDVSISKEEFHDHYASILEKVTGDQLLATERGADIAFQDLSLSVMQPDGETKHIVDHLTGRIEGKKMTALMGGSGAGKTSLLNALCGRAFYGKVSGTIYINGQEGDISKMKNYIGFVPQDDIVYPELTVMENFLYSGRFRLPAGTTSFQIQDLADKIIAELGLVRVKHSIVGDVTRRGLSGGEKKRVNIGLELMARPFLLFLDEPTSGLDSASSLLVMNGLKALTVKQNMTVCSVIHQPRKFIFEQFDSLVLLSVGGKMVYHGLTCKVKAYFEDMGYVLPEGENVADWVIDISTGSLMPEIPDPTDSPEINLRKKMRMSLLQVSDNTIETDLHLRERLTKSWREHFENLEDTERNHYRPPEAYDLIDAKSPPTLPHQTWLQIKRRLIVMKQNKFTHILDAVVIIVAFFVVTIINGPLNPVAVKFFRSMTYTDLESTMIPLDKNPIIAVSKFCSSFQIGNAEKVVSDLTQYAVLGVSFLNLFTLMLTGAVSIIVGIAAAKPIREKRLEFFRESGSGYHITAFHTAISLVSAVEFSVQMILATLLALYMRQSMVPWGSFILNSILLAWISAGWGAFYASWVPPDSVIVVVGFHMILMLFLSGGFNVESFSLKTMSKNNALNVISGIFSPGRFFIEAYGVNEAKCLQPQTGFTSKTLMLFNMTNFANVGLGAKDPNVSIRSCEGWYWNYLPMFLLGLTIRFITGFILHVANRSQMPRTPLKKKLKSRNILATYILVILGFFGFLAVTLWSFMVTRGSIIPHPSPETIVCDLVEMAGLEFDRSECEATIGLFLEEQNQTSAIGGVGGGMDSMTEICSIFSPSILS